MSSTWFGKQIEVKISNFFFHDILYTIRFVKMRRIQRYHFHYVNRVGRWPQQQNTAFFKFGTIWMMLLLCNSSVILKDIKFWIQWYWFHVNPSRTDGGINILPVFCNIKTMESLTIKPLKQWLARVSRWWASKMMHEVMVQGLRTSNTCLRFPL